jgi:uncharacterized protein
MTRPMCDVTVFFVLACVITWMFDAPLALAWLRHETPADYALGLVALGAFGPTFAAILVAVRRHEVRSVFGTWRTNPLWIVIGLFAPLALHLPATALEVALGGQPAQWFYPPVLPEHVAALVLFSVGEELGWRGYAYPRLAEQLGPVIGSVILGAVWGLWHLGMWFTPEHGAPALFTVVRYMVELALWSVVFAWVFERGNRSMAVAFALHAGGHVDNVFRAPESEVRLQVLRFLVLVVAAAVAARALTSKERAPRPATS